MTSPADWLDLTGKVALVTGAARGIGMGIADALNAAGATVVLTDIDEEEVKKTADGLGAIGVKLDVTDEGQVDQVIADIVANQGGLDIAVNNAGVYNEYGGPLVDMDTERFRGLMAVNVDGVFYCSRAEARVMIEAGKGGRIINVASTEAMSPGVGVNYDGSKGAVVQMTRTMALELSPHNIAVNALAPGATWVRGGPAPELPKELPPLTGQPLTDQVMTRISRIPMGRWGDIEEMGKVALFLASPMSDYMTGVYLPVDGGWLLE